MVELTLDPGDLEFGKVVTETDGLVETLAALEFEGDAFLSAMLLNDFGENACAFNSGSSDLGAGTIVDEEDLTKLDFVVSCHWELVDTDGVSFLHAVLFTAGFENCVGHDSGQLKFLR